MWGGRRGTGLGAMATLSVRGLKALVRERNLDIRYPIERSELIAALAAPEEAGRWVFWEG